MHRSYTVHSPTQIIRYSNRIEIRNVGYSLKDPTHLGSPGSRLRELASPSVSPDEAKVLIYVRATGAVDNTACRDFCGLDTLAASLVLRRLRDRGLLEKQGAGSRTYYTLTDALHQSPTQSNQTELPLGGPKDGNSPKDNLKDHGTQTEEGCNLELATLPSELATFVENLKSRSKEKALREGIRRLCAWTPLTNLCPWKCVMKTKYLANSEDDGIAVRCQRACHQPTSEAGFRRWRIAAGGSY